MASSAGISGSGGHSRQNSSASRRQAPKRMSTTGPLEGEDPLSAGTQDRSRSISTRRADLQTPSSRQASRSPAPPSVVDRPQRSFAFLLRPEIFHELNEADIPPAFQTDLLKPGLTDEIQPLITAGRFRAAAVLAAEKLKSFSDPSDYDQIFTLLFARLACMQLLGFHYEAAQEAKNVGDMNSGFYREPETGKHIAPWELRILVVRLQALAFGDWRRGVVGFYELAREARHFARRDSERASEWRTRLAELGLRVAMALVEMGELDGALRHMQALKIPADAHAKLQAQIALVYMRIGDVPAAQATLEGLRRDDDSTAATARILDALSEMADTEYDAALEHWEQLQPSASNSPGLKTLIGQNLAVCHVYTGDVVGARQQLQRLVDEGDSSHGVLFNLATLIELTSDKARETKTTLAQQAAAHTPTSIGWERANADFKL